MLNFLNKNKEKDKLEDEPKEKYYYFTILIEHTDLTFISKQKNQIENKIQNLRDSYLKAISYSFKVTEFNQFYSFDITDKDEVLEIIIPNLRDIGLIKVGETEL